MIKKKQKPERILEIKYEKRLCVIKHILKKQGKELSEEDKLNIDKLLDAINSFLKYNISQGNCNGEIKQFILDLTTLLSVDIVGSSNLKDIKNTLTQCVFHINDLENTQ